MSIFTKVQAPKVKSSVFNLSHESKLSCNFGDLVPILCQEVLPHDKFKISTELLVKLAPLKAPMMHKVRAYVHYFFVPTFQIDSVFADFINPRVNTDNSVVMSYCYPNNLLSYSKVNGTLYGSLPDYLGLPITQEQWLALIGDAAEAAGNAGKVLVDPFKAYQHIYNEYYRDQNLEFNSGNNLTDPLYDVSAHLSDSGPITGSHTINEIKNLFKLRKRAWAKDYFTSALPSPQAGDDVLIPMQVAIEPNGPLNFLGENDSLALSNATFGADQSGTSLQDENGVNAIYHGGLKASNGTATINDLRRAMALQRFKELAERGGTRYSEMVRNFFGAVLKDYWVDRPIFLGGMSKDVTVSEVVQQSASQDVEIGTEKTSAFLGQRAGIGNAYGRTKTVQFSSPCHGYIMGILSLRPEAVYSQGLERMWQRHSLYDWAFPQFARLGEQEIRNSEIFAMGSAENDGVFGYTPRYAEYKTGHSHIAGEFRRTLDYWTMSRFFAQQPTLSKEFVQMNNINYEPFVVTDPTQEHCYVDLYNKIYARRPLPYFGTPSVI